MDLRDSSPETLAWQDARIAAADEHLATLTARDEFERRVTGNLADGRRYPVIRRGSRWFQRLALQPDADHPVVVVRESPTGAPRVLVDPNAMSVERGVPVALMAVAPS